MQQRVETGGAVVISYAHEDVHRAAELAQLLSDAGVEVWWDRQIQIGDRWRLEIASRIDAAAKVVVLWSDHSRNSDFVRDEASRAKDAGKLLQLVLDTGKLPLGFGELQHRRVGDLKDMVPEILASLGRKAAPAGSFASTAQTRVSLTGLPTTSAKLFGREIELNRLLDAWESGKTNVFSLIAIGGTGKTALLRGFLNELHARGWAGATHVYAWSASSTASSRCRTCRSRTRAGCAAAASATTACVGSSASSPTRTRGCASSPRARRSSSLPTAPSRWCARPTSAISRIWRGGSCWRTWGCAATRASSRRRPRRPAGML